MEERDMNMTDEHMAQELRKSKGSKLGGKILSLLGVVIAVVGIILGGNLVMIVIGGVVLSLGQMVQGKSKDKAGRQTFDAIAPDIVGAALENVQMSPAPHLLDAEDTNIPLPGHHPLQRQWVYPRNISRPDHGTMYRKADGSQRVSTGGDWPVGKERAGGLHRPVDAV